MLQEKTYDIQLISIRTKKLNIMKILYFGGGLGNQIFEYSVYLTIKDKFPNSCIYGVYSKKRFKEHAGGLEIEKVFDVKLPPSSFLGNIAMLIIMVWNKYIHKTKYYCHDLTTPNWDAILFNAHKMVFSCYNKRKNWIEFKKPNLSNKNINVLNLIKSKQSISVHVRRGDFLSKKYAATHANIATLDYYKSAIDYVSKIYDNPYYFIFSDDIEWCKKNIKLTNIIYIDWNTGKNSWLDMYLQTFAKVNIIANSTFSYWGAYLNKNNNIVIYPKKWKTSEGNLDIFPENWIAM